jgi:hypothetical protein
LSERLVGFSGPTVMRSEVDVPQPDGPAVTVNPPCRMSS